MQLALGKHQLLYALVHCGVQLGESVAEFLRNEFRHAPARKIVLDEVYYTLKFLRHKMLAIFIALAT